MTATFMVWLMLLVVVVPRSDAFAREPSVAVLVWCSVSMRFLVDVRGQQRVLRATVPDDLWRKSLQPRPHPSCPSARPLFSRNSVGSDAV